MPALATRVAAGAQAVDAVRRFDSACLSFVRVRRRRGGCVVARMVSGTSEPAVACPLLLASACRVTGRPAARALRAVTVVAAGGAVRAALADLIARPRPPRSAWLVHPEGPSLPSRHTTLAALTVGVLVRVHGDPCGASRWVVPSAAAAAVGASRVWLGVHWPSDVVAAWAFALAWLWVTDLVWPDPAAKEP